MAQSTMGLLQWTIRLTKNECINVAIECVELQWKCPKTSSDNAKLS